MIRNSRLSGKSILTILLVINLINVTIAQQSQRVNAGNQSGTGLYSASSSGEVEVDDAFVRSTANGYTWTIGTKAIEMTYEAKNGLFKLISFKNKLIGSQQEYIPRNMAVAPFTAGAEDKATWVFRGAKASQTLAGGQPVASLVMNFLHGNLTIWFHIIAYPETSVIRQWIELENSDNLTLTAKAIPFVVPVKNDPTVPFMHYWMVGGNSHADQGMLCESVVTSGYSKTIAARATYAFIPWTAFQRSGMPNDGMFVALEYMGKWSFSVNQPPQKQMTLTVDVPDLASVPLAPGEKITLPAVTIGTFAGTLDEMGVQTYNWQYRYMWDYTNMDYYAHPKWAVPWAYCAQNLQEQFAERLAYLDMNAEIMRSIGFEMLWDDAGWSSYNGMPPNNYTSVFSPTYEGPDFSQTRRFLDKMGMGWLAWFAGRPSSGVIAGKIGSWGDFEWRTDAVNFPDWNADRDWRNKILYFLDNYPGSSFHTCSGGSSYSHTFDIQRFANTNYFSDSGRGPQTNYFFSYMEPPDKWVDIIEPWSNRGNYKPETSRQTLTMVPFWGLKVNAGDRKLLREDLDIYRFLLHEGVAGRWSYMFHPKVKGDEPFYYAQRTSYNRHKACIILKHKATGPVTVFPYGLLPDHLYEVAFDLKKEVSIRTGTDIMTNGISLTAQLPGELIYLGLPNRPGSGNDKQLPNPPGKVFIRQEMNIGYSGIGVYWSAGKDNNWISSYEVRRGRRNLGKVSVGTSYFDRSPGWGIDADYAVRTIDGDGNTSDWILAEKIPGEPAIAYALGSLSPERGLEGWYADVTTDGVHFEPMTWINPPKTSSADEGGTPNQPGGIEGWWEGTGGARLGRAWMQSSREACSVRTWVAPKSGNVQIASRVMKEWYRQSAGTPLRARILHNTRQIWPNKGWALIPLNNIAGVTHNLTEFVKKDDSIRFVLDKCDNPENDFAAWMPFIKYADPNPIERNENAVRILCGSSLSYTDRSGNTWMRDCFFTGGQAKSFRSGIQGGQDSSLYELGRFGKDFTYDIPVKKGVYTVLLMFAEPEYEHLFSRPFNVEINGKEMLHNYDICQDSRGYCKEKDRVFKYIVTNADNKIVIRFSGGFEPRQKSNEAIVQAIEILPAFNPVVRINCGAVSEFIDWNSFIWDSDHSYLGGQTLNSSSSVSQTTPTLYDQALYQSARSGREISYSLSLPQGLYTVHLKFAELWLKDTGKRPMDIEINGKVIWKSWDPGSAAGQVGMAIDLRAQNITPDKDGFIKIRLRAVDENDAILQGIEVL